MKTLMTKEELQAFEEDIAQIFDAGKIKAPVHSENGNEEQLIEIFKEINEEDYVCGTWRQHYKCLLKGVPPEQLKADILAGKSITLCYKEHKIFSSAIVGGIIPIALGIAFDLKRKQSKQKVWLFVGDMGANTGAMSEALAYAQNFDLPITFVIEDNNKSVCTDTRKVWGAQKPWWADFPDPMVRSYEYSSKWPHAGFGKRISF